MKEPTVQHERSRDEPTKVLILGGGFGGLHTARALERKLGRRTDVEITLVNRENFTLFTPMLHEVAGSDVDVTHIVNPIRQMLRRTTFFEGTVEHIDLAARRVVVSHGEAWHRHELTYDQLVIALGAVTNFHGDREVERRALTMKSLADAIALRNRLIENLEQADFDCSMKAHGRPLTVLVAGGGFAGVETTAAVNDLLRESSRRAYPHLSQQDIRVVLVESGPSILPELGGGLGAYAQAKLEQRGVEVRVKTRVVGATDAGVRLSDGTEVPAGTIVWTAGLAPNPILVGLPCKTDRGRLIVNQYLEVEGHPGVWALGDCALIPDPKGGFYPPTAQHALREGKVLGRNIAAAIRSGTKTPFVFSTIGLLAAIGRRTGVARILGLNFSGFFAWALWRGVYLSKLPRLDRKIRIGIDWALDLVFPKDLVQFKAVDEPQPDRDGAVREHPARVGGDQASR
jgi:NADH dehydrogenase